jgi:peptide/nickel transport system substrate-binding protein
MTLMTPTGDRVAFRRRKDYWKPQTKADVPTFIQQSVPEGGNRLALLLAGQAQYADVLTPLENELAKKRGMNVQHVDSTIVLYMVVHLKPPFVDKEVRQALARAIPYEQILKTVYRGTAKPYKSILTPFVPGYTEKYWKYDTDLNAARTVLSKLNTQFTLWIVEGLPVDQQAALLMQASFNRAGLPTTIQTINRATFAVQRRNGGLQAFLASYISPAFPTANYYGLVHCSSTGAFNYINFANAAMDKAIADASPGNPRSVQEAAADTIQRIAMEELPIHPIAWTGTDYAMARFMKLPYARNAGGQIYWPDLQIDHTKL